MSEPGDTGIPEQASRWEDYIDVFFSPVELFQRRARDRVAPPLITVLLLALVLYFVFMPANAMIMRAAAADNPQALEAMERMGLIFQIAGAITIPFTYFAFLGFAAVLLWLVGRFAEIRTEFSRTMLIATYGGFILLLSQVASGVVVLLHGETGLDPIRDLSFGLLRFTGDEGAAQALTPLLRRVDVFAIWQAVLWAIGIRVIYGTTQLQAAVTGAAAWLLFAVPGLILAAFGFSPMPGG